MKLPFFKYLRYVSFLILCGWQLTSCSSDRDKENIYPNIQNLTNKNPETIKEILGEPDSVYNLTIINKKVIGHIYQDQQLEIQYLSPAYKSNDILVKTSPDVPFDSTALSKFDIPPVKPNQIIPGRLLRWKNYQGFKTISFYSPVYRNDSLQSFTIFFKYKEE